MPSDSPSSAQHEPVRRWLLPFALGAVVLVIGWWATWFFCDDAFIAFRYVGNAYDGHGLVWNPAPFRPVEGYTSFLWIWLLQQVWQVTGLAPPQTANWLALACGLSTLLVIAGWLARRSGEARGMARTALAALVLLGIAGNHSFATWCSSGLETALFGLFAVAWTLTAAGRPLTSWSRLALLAGLATGAQLTRPDGALLLLATFGIAAQAMWRRRLSVGAVVVGLLPVLLSVAHLLWRRAFYGEWLPNTYYAKVVGAWPESGLRYLFCFALEHGVAFWLLLALPWAAVSLRRPGALRALFVERFAATAAVLTWAAYVGYYTLIVGGDHFAYRVFAHLVPLLFVSAFVMLTSLRWRPRWSGVCLLLFAIAANAPGWWLESRMRGHEADGYVRVAPQVPALLQPLARVYDREIAWLRLHHVGMRRASHAFYCAIARSQLPVRATGLVAAPPGVRLIHRADAVGVVSWSLADVCIIDGKGLNDWVVARSDAPPQLQQFDLAVLPTVFPTFDRDGDARLSASEIGATTVLLTSVGLPISDAAWAELMFALGDDDGDDRLDVRELTAVVRQLVAVRHMAHERVPPAGYIEALRPNVENVDGNWQLKPGVAPMSDAEIVAVEREYRARVTRR